MFLLVMLAIIAAPVRFAKPAELLADSNMGCWQTAELGMPGRSPLPHINQNHPTRAGYMPKKFTNIQTTLGAKSLYMKTGEAARLLENNLFSPSGRELNDSINRKLATSPTDEPLGNERSVQKCGATETHPHDQVFKDAKTSQPSDSETFGQPSEDEGVRILESDAGCAISAPIAWHATTVTAFGGGF
ncbi:hypothetical protein PtB15_8B540 [Puccinia triticina]|nr:hypothetical protein PtB15_8B540 [Puccinia triticina]